MRAWLNLGSNAASIHVSLVSRRRTSNGIKAKSRRSTPGGTNGSGRLSGIVMCLISNGTVNRAVLGGGCEIRECRGVRVEAQHYLAGRPKALLGDNHLCEVARSRNALLPRGDA